MADFVGSAACPWWPVGMPRHPPVPGSKGGADHLEVWLLVGGGDAGVAEEGGHAPRVAQPCDISACGTLIADTACGRIYTVQRRGRGGRRRNERFRDSACRW